MPYRTIYEAYSQLTDNYCKYYSSYGIIDELYRPITIMLEHLIHDRSFANFPMTLYL